MDTSAVFALLDADDRHHETARRIWAGFLSSRQNLVTTNYVLMETFALVQRRLGLPRSRDFQTAFVPILGIQWVGSELHERAVSALITAGLRELSLVDCVSFELMRQMGLAEAFAFDDHFNQQGFRCLS